MSDFAEALAQTSRASDDGRAFKVPAPSVLDLTTLCILFGEDPAVVARELRKDTALARLARKAFGFDAHAVRGKRLGRPRTMDAAHSRDHAVFKALRRNGETAEKAYQSTALIRGKEGRCGRNGKKITEEGIRSAILRRANSFGDLFHDIDDSELQRLRSK